MYFPIKINSLLLLLVASGFVQNASARPCVSEDRVIAITSGKIKFTKSAEFDSVMSMGFSAGEVKTSDSLFSGRYVWVSSFQTGQSGKTMFIRSVGVTSVDKIPTLEVVDKKEYFKQGANLANGYFGVIYFRSAKLNPRPSALMSVGSLKYNLGRHARLSELECRDISREEFRQILVYGNTSFLGNK
jgi:hypothetical protein